MTIRVDFVRGARFGHPRAAGEHKVRDTETKRLRHLNFFQHRCILEVRLPRVTLPDDGVAWRSMCSSLTPRKAARASA
jgi:transposase